MQIMKKILLVVAFVVFFGSAYAQNNNVQFSNNGFEQWSSSQPTGWNTLGYSGFNLCDISKSTHAAEGSYSVEMRPQLLPTFVATLLGMEPVAVPGLITNGTINFSEIMTLFGSFSNAGATEFTDYMTILQSLKNVLSNGLSLNELPTNISGFYDFQPQGTDEWFVVLSFATAKIADSTAVIGGGVYYTNQATVGYENFSLPMQYLINNNNEAELYLIALVADLNSEATNYGKVNLDNININYGNVSLNSEKKNEENIFAFPNPANNEFYLNTNEITEVSVFDVMGREIKKVKNYQPYSSIRLEKSGTYIVKTGEKYLKLIVK